MRATALRGRVEDRQTDRQRRCALRQVLSFSLCLCGLLLLMFSTLSAGSTKV